MKHLYSKSTDYPMMEAAIQVSTTGFHLLQEHPESFINIHITESDPRDVGRLEKSLFLSKTPRRFSDTSLFSYHVSRQQQATAFLRMKVT